MSEKIHILNVRLPKDTVEWLNSLVKADIYSSKSEAVRDFVREYLKKDG